MLSEFMIILIMENKQNNNDSKSAQEILKKIESESPQQKKNKAYEILLRKPKPTLTTAKAAVSYFEMAKKMYDKKYTEIIRKWKSPERQKAVWLTAFLAISTFICWRVELKFDRIRKKASTTKTFKEAQIEKENIEINKYLSRNQFEPVPITTEPEIKNSYKFQEVQGVFDTREYLLEQVAKEYRDGNQIDVDMINELKQKGYI